MKYNDDFNTICNYFVVGLELLVLKLILTPLAHILPYIYVGLSTNTHASCSGD